MSNIIKSTPKAVSVFKSTDKDAPVLDNQTGSLINLLDACLVTGYGDKQPLGWEKCFPAQKSNNLGVYRSKNPRSARPFLTVENAAQKYANVVAYCNMTASDNGTGLFGRRPKDNYRRFAYIPSEATKNENWWLIGHDSTFIFICTKAESRSGVARGFYDWATCLIFGDYPSIVPNDTGNSLLFCLNNGYDYMTCNRLSFSQGISENSITSIGLYLSKSWNGFEDQDFTAHFATMCRNNGCRSLYPDKINGGLIASEVYFLEQNLNIRGMLPGIFKTQNSLIEYRAGSIFKMDGSDDNYMNFCFGEAETDHYLINTSFWAS